MGRKVVSIGGSLARVLAQHDCPFLDDVDVEANINQYKLLRNHAENTIPKYWRSTKSNRIAGRPTSGS